MSKLDYRIENIQPVLRISDMTASVHFYCDLLEFENAPWGDDDYTSVSRNNSCIYLCRNGQGNPGTWVWIGFDGDLDSLHSNLVARGVTIAEPPTNFSWAYEMKISDPDGHILRFGTDPRENEPFADR